VGEDRLDVSQIHAQGDWTGAFASALLAEIDQPIAIKFLQMQKPKSSLKKSKTRIFGTSDPLSYLLEVIAMKADKIPEFSAFTAARRERGLSAIDAPLDFECPFFGIFAAEKRVIDILSLPSHLDAPRARFEPGKGRHGVCAPCALRRRTGA
jgi:hypothetical protein